MKKSLKLLAFGFLFLASGLSISAQENYGNTLNGFLKFGDKARIGAYYEIQIVDNFTLSPEIVLPFNFSDVKLGVRADYYFDNLLKLKEPWDIYAGLDSGIIVGGDDNFDLNIHAGAEYKFHKNWGVVAEFGGGSTTTGGIGMAYHF